MEEERTILKNLFDYDAFIILVTRLTLNLIVVSLIVIPKFIRKQRKEFAAALYLFNFVIFVLCFVLSQEQLHWTAGIGLFAVFAMLRFRSEMVNLMDMTYLLVIISIGFINAAFNGSISLVEIILLNLGLFIMVYILDITLLHSKLKHKKIKHVQLDLIDSNKDEELLQNLSKTTGLDVKKVSIESIDINENQATVEVFYMESNRINNKSEKTPAISKKLTKFFKGKQMLETNGE